MVVALWIAPNWVFIYGLQRGRKSRRDASGTGEGNRLTFSWLARPITLSKDSVDSLSLTDQLTTCSAPRGQTSGRTYFYLIVTSSDTGAGGITSTGATRVDISNPQA